MSKYEVIGAKTGSMGRTLSKHNKLAQAKASAKRYAAKGYSGAIYTKMKVKPGSKVHKYYKGGYKKKHYLRSRITFGPKIGVKSVSTKSFFT